MRTDSLRLRLWASARVKSIHASTATTRPYRLRLSRHQSHGRRFFHVTRSESERQFRGSCEVFERFRICLADCLDKGILPDVCRFDREKESGIRRDLLKLDRQFRLDG